MDDVGKAAFIDITVTETMLFAHAVNKQLNVIRGLLATALGEPAPVIFCGASPESTFDTIDSMAALQAKLVTQLAWNRRIPEEDEEEVAWHQIN